MGNLCAAPTSSQEYSRGSPIKEMKTDYSQE